MPSVFSTYVEVILLLEHQDEAIRRILHVCGGDPSLCSRLIDWILYSPRMWRWSYWCYFWKKPTFVFSTYVEVILVWSVPALIKVCILHVCGGDPIFHCCSILCFMYSPRMWRWSCKLRVLLTQQQVFSTYVEVIPSCWSFWTVILSILHVCGGDPDEEPSSSFDALYSPRMWRWSYTPCPLKVWQRVFSTYVEVILIPTMGRNQVASILHVCGGDPQHICKCSDKAWYSPRMWRWSLKRARRQQMEKVFSTYVEVILKICSFVAFGWCILHVCGGDPE